MKPPFFIRFDQVWCQNHQVSASLLSSILSDTTKITAIARFRFLLFLSLIAELFGYFFTTFGLTFQHTIWFFLSGVLLKIGGTLCGAFFQNQAGVLISVELQTSLNKLRTHALEMKAFLSERGCSESEIQALQTLPSDVYQSELNGYQRIRILNIGIPIFCGIALLINGDILTSVIVILLGLLSFPIGEQFFRENAFRKESELRLGRAAQLVEYIDQVYREHVWLTMKVNSLSQLPLLLFALRWMWNGTGQLLSSFFGLTQGLAGLTGTLAFQKARVAAMRTTETTSHIIQALSSCYLIATPKRWKEHSQTCTENIPPQPTSGVVLVNFSPTVPFQEKKTSTFSCFIPSGTSCILQAPSGRGKSTFLAAITHLIEHTGDLFFCSNQHAINTHELSQEQFYEQLFFFREETVDHSFRIIDLFKKIRPVENQVFAARFNPLLRELAWKTPDNLLQQEIINIETNKQSVFPKSMLEFLKDLRNRQITAIQSFLTKAKGNLASSQIFPERTFSTLSSGEKKALVALLALETCRYKQVRLVIFDEPFTHLDRANLSHQMDRIQQIQNLPSAPSLLLISHQFVEEIKKHVNCCGEIHLDAH